MMHSVHCENLTAQKDRAGTLHPALSFSVLQPLVTFSCQPGTHILEDLHKNHQNYHGKIQNRVFIAVVADHNGDFSDASAADGAAHGGIAQNRGDGEREIVNQ